jgi:hypothetical protein
MSCNIDHEVEVASRDDVPIDHKSLPVAFEATFTTRMEPNLADEAEAFPPRLPRLSCGSIQISDVPVNIW